MLIRNPIVRNRIYRQGWEESADHASRDRSAARKEN
jgi:hypothetical protein